MNIAVDMDDVIVRFCESMVEKLNHEFDIELTMEDSEDWGWLKKGRVPGGEWTYWDWLQERAWLWATFPPVRGALGGLEALGWKGHDVYIVTTKPKWAWWVPYAWVGKHRPKVRGLVVTESDQAGKLETVGEWCDAIVDDKPATLMEWYNSGKHAICFDAPVNRPLQSTAEEADLGGTFSVAKNWKDVLTIVDSIEWALKTAKEAANALTWNFPTKEAPVGEWMGDVWG